MAYSAVRPLGNDFLLRGLSASRTSRVPLYIADATLGSVCGVALPLWLSRKAGQQVSKTRKGRTWKYVAKHNQQHAAFLQRALVTG